MPFYPDDAPVPDGLQSDEFVLVPLAPEHNAIDYDAVMASQQELRKRGGGEWPRPDFTPEENLADLEEHADDFRARRGFTYSVQTPDGTRCLGCVYVYPLADSLRRRGVDEATLAGLGDRAGFVWFWVRPDSKVDRLEERLFAALLPWLRMEFAFARLAVLTWSAAGQQTALCREAGLKRIWPESDEIEGAHYFDVLG